jgi:hypothetical protein
VLGLSLLAIVLVGLFGYGCLCDVICCVIVSEGCFLLLLAFAKAAFYCYCLCCSWWVICGIRGVSFMCGISMMLGWWDFFFSGGERCGVVLWGGRCPVTLVRG